MTSSINTRCPYCGSEYAVKGRHIGVVVKCTKCQKPFQVSPIFASVMRGDSRNARIAKWGLVIILGVSLMTALIALFQKKLPRDQSDEIGRVAAVHGDDFYDLNCVGEIGTYGASTIPLSEFEDLNEIGWLTKRTLGFEKSGGIDVQFKYPCLMNCDNGNQPHVVFHIGRVFSNTKTQAALSVGVWPYDEKIITLLRQLKKSDVENPGFLMLAETLAKGHGKLIGAGITTMENRPVIWMTTQQERERLGVKLKMLLRMFVMPATGGRCVVASYGIASADIDGCLYGDFEQFNSIGLKFVNSFTFMDKSQVGSAISFECVGSGTGWFLAPEYVVTCWHVLQGHSQYFFVKSTGERGRLVLVGKDEFSDIAILKVSELKDACKTPLKLSDQTVRASQKVFTVGYPIPDLMGKAPKYTEGVISALSGIGDDELKLQITTPVQSGNSGGALLNDKGEVIGVVQSKLVNYDLEEFAETIQNVNYAVKVHLVKTLANKLLIELPSTFVKGDSFDTAKNATVFIEVK